MLKLVFTFLVLLLALLASAQQTQQPIGSSFGAVVSLQPILTNLTAVTSIRFAVPPGWDRPVMFIAEQHGRIWWFDYQANASTNASATNNNTLPQFNAIPQSNLILDISSEIVKLSDAYDERGLVGMEFHPEFEQNGRFWIWYSAPPLSGANNGSRLSCSSTSLNAGAKCDANGNDDHTNILAEYRLGSSNVTMDSMTAASDMPPIMQAERVNILLTVPWPFFNHNSINMLHFNRIDRRLYFGFGDGGCAYDPFERAQNLDMMFGKIMSLDVWAESSNLSCSAPVTTFSQLNAACPQVSQILRLYAIGVRNPSGLSFFNWQDFVTDNSSLISQEWAAFLADVGQDNVEKISVAYEEGQNFGWSLMEGTLCVNRSKYDLCVNASSSNETSMGNSSTIVSLPVTQLFHKRLADRSPTAILGGGLYNGTLIPELLNKYLYVSLSSSLQGSGRLYMFDVLQAFDQGAWNRTFDTAVCQPLDASLNETLRASQYSIDNWNINPLNAFTVRSKVVGIDYDFASKDDPIEQAYALDRYYKAIGYSLDQSEFFVSIDSEIGLGNNTNSIYKIVSV